MPNNSAELLDCYRQGDEAAATELFRRYAERLAAVARGHIGGKLSGRLDADDIVQSAYRSFFIRARDGEFALRHSGDLWRLLVGIVRHKLLSQVERHSATRRSIHSEERFDTKGQSLAEAEALAREPSAEEATLATELLAAIMADLTPVQRRVLELRLQDCTLDEMANQTRRSERTVRRWLEAIKSQWAERLAGDAP